jgi:hypothetical protein
MFKALGSLFAAEGEKTFTEEDMKYDIQAYVQGELKTDRVVCQALRRGQLEIRVGTPALKQLVQLLEYDIQQRLQECYQYELKRLRIFMG